jgi:putative ABC transport system substrate-binding protein
VDLIVATPTAAVVAAKNATSRIPIVMLNVGDPVGLGLVGSLARPSGNVTGLSFSVGMETLEKALGLLKEAAPDVRLLAVLSNPSNPAQPLLLKTLQTASTVLGFRLQLLEARGLDEFEEAFAAMATGHADALFVAPDVVFVAHRMRLADLALKNKLPSMHHFRAAAEAGALMSYGSDLAEPFARAAAYADKLLKGAKPSDLPVEQPTKFELVINLKTAKALNLTIPPTLLARADGVIE